MCLWTWGKIWITRKGEHGRDDMSLIGTKTTKLIFSILRSSSSAAMDTRLGLANRLSFSIAIPRNTRAHMRRSKHTVLSKELAGRWSLCLWAIYLNQTAPLSLTDLARSHFAQVRVYHRAVQASQNLQKKFKGWEAIDFQFYTDVF